MPTAVITGASRGLGRALAPDLAAAGWRLVVDARDGRRPAAAAAPLGTGRHRDPRRRHRPRAPAGARRGRRRPRLDLLVYNAAALGPSRCRRWPSSTAEALRDVLETNVVAPHALTRLLLPALRAGGRLRAGVTSDAAVEAYPGWGGYGASKAALDQLAAVLAAEEPLLRVYAVDPGDMRTAMHQDAFPGEDISDRPEPAAVVPAPAPRWSTADLPNGRYEAAALARAGAPA